MNRFTNGAPLREGEDELAYLLQEKVDLLPAKSTLPNTRVDTVVNPTMVELICSSTSRLTLFRYDTATAQQASLISLGWYLSKFLS